jgi:pimeloyl-ACP methyl ester carboxylesterase
MDKLTRIAAGIVAVAAAAVAVVTGGTTAEGAAPARGHGHYADVNGLRMYYEVHGKDRTKPPLVLIHGAFSATGTSWGEIIRPLARGRTVISVEQQGHGHTGDVVDRPLRMSAMAEDTVALLDRLGVREADFYGYSMGAGVALMIGLHHPERVGRLVLQSLSTDATGYHPGYEEGMESVTPDMLHGSVFHEEYVRTNPHPENFDLLVEKVKDMVRAGEQFPADAIRAMDVPVLTIVGDSDIVRPEHAVELFRLTGGGVNGDITGLPESRLAVLPGATHITSVQQRDLLVSLVPSFLDAG